MPLTYSPSHSTLLAIISLKNYVVYASLAFALRRFTDSIVSPIVLKNSTFPSCWKYTYM